MRLKEYQARSAERQPLPAEVPATGRAAGIAPVPDTGPRGEALGYGHEEYARSLGQFGAPRRLDHSGAWVIQRHIPGSPLQLEDAMGCYPLLTCPNWAGLGADLAGMQEELVSFCAVLDPFGDFDASALNAWFPDLVLPFKEHFVIDLSPTVEVSACKNHQRNAARALARVRVEISETPAAWTCDWVCLYDALIRRHAIRGIRAFSRAAFERQLQTPGMVAFRAVTDTGVLGMLLWYQQGENAYYHLGAHTEEGYDAGASFALFKTAIDEFARRGVLRLDLGAGAGVRNDGTDGLSRFKRGWATGTRMAYFCGRIFNREAYCRLTAGSGIPASGYFPAYRSGEFA